MRVPVGCILSAGGCSTCFAPTRSRILTNPVACALLQVDVLVSYGLTYSFPIEEEETGAGGMPRAAPLAPSIDTLHAYSALSQPVARFLGDRRALKPGWAKGVPLTMRQMLAQRISTAVITRLEQVRMTCVAGGAPAAGWQSCLWLPTFGFLLPAACGM